MFPLPDYLGILRSLSGESDDDQMTSVFTQGLYGTVSK